MEQEIKFRAKCFDSGEWVYGYYVFATLYPHSQPHHYIFPATHTVAEIDPETVGQYVGLKDKKGNEAYVGDTYQYEILIQNYDDDDGWNPRNHNRPQYEHKTITDVIVWDFNKLVELEKISRGSGFEITGNKSKRSIQVLLRKS